MTTHHPTNEQPVSPETSPLTHSEKVMAWGFNRDDQILPFISEDPIIAGQALPEIQARFAAYKKELLADPQNLALLAQQYDERPQITVTEIGGRKAIFLNNDKQNTHQRS